MTLALIRFTLSIPQGLGAVLPFAFDLAKSQQFNELFIDNFNCLSTLNTLDYLINKQDGISEQGGIFLNHGK